MEESLRVLVHIVHVRIIQTWIVECVLCRCSCSSGRSRFIFVSGNNLILVVVCLWYQLSIDVQLSILVISNVLVVRPTKGNDRVPMLYVCMCACLSWCILHIQLASFIASPAH